MFGTLRAGRLHMLRREDPRGAQPVLSARVHPPRNKPCPCGSSKKFKHCHGQAYKAMALIESK